MIPVSLLPILGKTVLILGIFLAGWYVNGNRWEVKYQKLEAEYTSFSNGVARLGEQAKTKNALIALADLKKKERVDEENRRTSATLRVRIKQLRNERDNARRSGVPAAPAGASRPELACFDRPELERAYGELVTEIRGLADAGTEATVDLNAAKQWAQTPRSE